MLLVTFFSFTNSSIERGWQRFYMQWVIKAKIINIWCMNIKEKWVWLIYLWTNMRHDWVLKYWWPMNVLSYIVETSRFPWNIVHRKRDMKVSLLNTCTWRMTFSKNWAWNGIIFPLCYPLKLYNIFQSKEICRCSSLLFSWSFFLWEILIVDKILKLFELK